MKFTRSNIITALSLTSLCIIAIVTAIKYKAHYTSEFINQDIYSEYLNEKRRIFIRLPNNYDKHKQYPLIIKSDGNFNLKRWHQTIAKKASQGLIEDSILVAIPNQFWRDTRNRDLVPPYARKDVQIEARSVSENDPTIFGQADTFLQFIEHAVIPLIETNYPINNNRVLSGFSTDGSFTLYTLVTNPNLFSE